MFHRGSIVHKFAKKKVQHSQLTQLSLDWIDKHIIIWAWAIVYGIWESTTNFWIDAWYPADAYDWYDFGMIPKQIFKLKPIKNLLKKSHTEPFNLTTSIEIKYTIIIS